MFISLTEAATLLGLNKETLRNWDKSGKLRSHRDPVNNYRQYKLSEVEALVSSGSLKQEKLIFTDQSTESAELNHEKTIENSDRDFKRSLNRVHKLLRDIEGSSSLVERFDEITKLIFLKLLSEKNDVNSFDKQSNESQAAYAKRLKTLFVAHANEGRTFFPEKFKHIRLSDKALIEAANVFSGIDLTGVQQDIKGIAYEEMIKNTFDKGDHQQFFTPKQIVEFLVSFIGSDMQGYVCDPASGTGGFLVEAIKQKKPIKKLLGLEIDERLAWVAGVNLQVHGALNFETRHLLDAGSLGKGGAELKNTIDVIITNPPFGSDLSGIALEDFNLGVGRSSRRRGVLFIERSLDMLKPGGLLGMVIDEGVLSLPTNEDVRRLILEQSEVLAVISLPDTTFMPYASVATSIIILRKINEKRKTKNTFFARAENIGRKPNGDLELIYDSAGNASLNSDLPQILEVWKKFKSTGNVESSENIYLADFSKDSLTVSKVLGHRLDFRFHHPSRLAAERALSSSKRKFIRLSELCNFRNESYIPSVNFYDQMIPYTGLAQIDARVGRAQQIMVSGSSLKSAVKKFEYGDILFAKMRPSSRKVAYTEFQEAGYASAECLVLTIKKDDMGRSIIDPNLLSIFLRSDYVYGQIIHLIAGIGRPRISLKDLLNIKVPLIENKKQSELLEDFYIQKEAYETQRAHAKKLSDEANRAELDVIEKIGKQFVGL